MGYFGQGAFENDQGLDWLGDTRAPQLAGRIAQALERYASFDEQAAVPLDEPQIRQRIDRLLATLRACAMPPHQKQRHGTKAAWLAATRSAQEDHYRSGRYLDERHGPVEEMLAAAELLAAWGGQPATLGVTERERRRVARLVAAQRGLPVPRALLGLALACVDKALASPRYRRMRAFYLAASPQLSGGDDGMAMVDDLRGRIAALLRDPGPVVA